MLQSRSWMLFSLLCACFPVCYAESKFTTFDLFKNTGFLNCPPKFTNATKFGNTWISQTGTVEEVSRGEQFCNSVGDYITVVLPSEAHGSAFSPGWFSLALQITGWVASFVGFWKSLPPPKQDATTQDEAESGRPPAQPAIILQTKSNSEFRSDQVGLHPPTPEDQARTDPPLPKSFWIMLPYEICRQLAWWIQVIRAFTDLPEASWISPVMFVAPALSTQYFAILFGSDKRLPFSGGFSFSRRRARLSFVFFASIFMLFAISHIGMFITTIVLLVKRVITDVSSVNYTILPSVIKDPSLLGVDLPPKCQEFISKWESQGLWGPNYVTDPQGSWWTWIQIGQFVVCLWVFVRMGNAIRGAERVITATIFQLSLCVGASLLVPAVYQAIQSPLGGKGYHSTLVNGGIEHGVCNLVILFIDKRLGYVDVKYQRAERVVLGFLGVQ